jgi:hypothetical protein
VQSPIEAPAEQAHYPPGYSTLLVIASFGGADPLNAARWAAAILLAANALLAAQLVFRSTASTGAGLFTAGAVAFSPVSIEYHTLALSEPLFISLWLLSLLALMSHLDQPRWKRLIAAGLLTGAAMLTRYAGAYLIPSGILLLLLLNQRPCRRRVFDAVIFTAVAMLLPIGWSIRNRLMLGSATNRVVAFHPISPGQVIDLAQVCWQWIGWREPVRLYLTIAAAAIALIVLLSALWSRNKLAPAMLINIVCFGITLALSISLVDAHTPVDVRVLLPVYVAWLILAGCLMARWLSHSTRWGTIGLSLLAALCVWAGVRSALLVHEQWRDGAGFAHEIWRNSPTIAAMRRLPPELIVYSNAPGAGYLLTGRPIIITIPAPQSASSLLPNPEYAESMQRIETDVRAGRAVVVYLRNYGKRRANYPSAADVQQKLGLRISAQFSDGTIMDASLPGATASQPATEPPGSRPPR